MSSTLLPAFALAILALGTTPGISFAQAAPAAQARTHAQECNIEDSLGAFVAVKDQASGRVTVQPTEEFRLQKDLLQKIIICMESETDAMAATLNDLKDLEDELAASRDQFVKILAEYRERQERDARRLRDIPELKDVKQFAKDLLAWREEEYRPALQDMLALSYIVHGRDSLKTASTRLQKINAALRTLGLGGNRELRILLDKAARQIKDAGTLNNEAYELFIAARKPEPAPETDQSTSTAALAANPLASEAGALDLPKNATSTETGKAEPEQKPAPEARPHPKDAAKEALVKIRDAYRLFVNASEAVRRLLN